MNQILNWLRGYWDKFVRLSSAGRTKDQRINDQSVETSEDTVDIPVGRLYYSIPGRSYEGYIDKGRILKTNYKGPFSRW